jgi:4-coumarate--CoA ligase (photoactive yellow protein activation family)
LTGAFLLDRGAIRLVAEDRLRAEIAAARAGNLDSLPPRPWPDDLPIGAGGLGADSLEILALAAAMNETFHIHDHGTEDFLLARKSFGAWVDLAQEAQRGHAGRLSFQSSGSSGTPKRCTHALDRLVAEADEHAGRLRPLRVLSAVPAHHIYGFIFSVLLPLRAGCARIDIRGRLPRREACQPGDVLVSFPEHWRYLARSWDRLPAVTGVSSAAPLPPEMARELRERGLGRLVEIYGSSETAGLAWRERPDQPYELLRGWMVERAPEAEGVLHLRQGGAAFATPDLVTMAGPRAFHLRGRADGAVQVGGVNVYPEAIARALEAHPLVGQARVRLAAQAEGGRLKALVVPRDAGADEAALRAAIDAWMAHNLGNAERPRSVTIVPSLPRTAMGKDADWAEPG